MRLFSSLFLVVALAACSSSSSEQTTDQDSAIDDTSSSGGDVGSDTSRDATTDSIAIDTGGGGEVSPDSASDVAIDANTDGGPCGAGGACGPGLTCCGDTCRNTNNDPFHCGGCDTTCNGSTSMCLGGSCAAPVCAPTCSGDQICCEIDGPGPTHFTCVAGPTCPIGCPSCK